MDWCCSRSLLSEKKEVLIEHESSEALIEKTKYFSGSYNMTVDKTFDVRQAIKQISNIRYKMVIEQLDLEDVAPERLASKMGVTVDNLYNIHRRALLQLRLIMKKKEDYV